MQASNVAPPQHSTDQYPAWSRSAQAGIMSSMAIRVAIRLWCASRRTSSVTSIVFGIAVSVFYRRYRHSGFQFEGEGRQGVIQVLVLQNYPLRDLYVGGREVPDSPDSPRHH